MALGWLGPQVASAQVSGDDYHRAQQALAPAVTPLIDHMVTHVHWLDPHRFWYLDTAQSAARYVLVDAATQHSSDLFDATDMAKALTAATGKTLQADGLAVTGYWPQAGGKALLRRGGQYFECTTRSELRCSAASAEAIRQQAGGLDDQEPAVLSPDHKQAAFIRNWNLWLRDTATGKETQLTTDGVENFGYATDNAGWKHTDHAILVWSPDSRRIATFQQDQRQDGDMYLVTTQVGHPRLLAWKYPLVGDKQVTMIQRVIIDVASRHVVRLKMPPDQHRSSLCDDISCGPDGGWDDVKWAADSRSLAFVSTSRDHRHEWFRVADPLTGAVRTVFDEQVATWFESGNDMVNWQYLPASHEVIWFSERDGWGQLYLYDLDTGKLKAQITHGAGNVTQVLRVDPATRQIWFRGVGKEAGWDPYYQAFYRIGFDGRGLTLLTPQQADHSIDMAPGGADFVDVYSTPVQPPVTVLRSADGRERMTLARTDIHRLLATGWAPPVPFTVKGRDGKTDLYGLMYKPTRFDASKHYPLIDYVYPGPQTGSVRGRSFLPAAGDNQALADLGFIVIAVDGMGTPWRSKAFHTAYFQHIEDDTLPDQVTAIRQLGQRYPWIDLSRVGIWGHSGGGNTAAAAMFHYPDVFKVGIAESGNHDNREYEDDWAEKWQGLETTDGAGHSNYDAQANESFVSGLKGHLMLAFGTLDDNVPPTNTLLVVDALIKANKDFDLVVIPNAHHGYGAAANYMMRRRWDYFVRYLMGAEPPKEYPLPVSRH
ncbi:S9 family peptidase [Frateuria aurantia]